MTIVAKHLKCDNKSLCGQCSSYIFPPDSELKFYFHCPLCKWDILCDRGVISNFQYDEFTHVESKINQCMRCRSKLEERTWPPDKEIQ
ncbi:MAG: hypothetical protein ACTSYA_03235 [Candidatus Kariarchaeaceae archaeon]